MKTIEQNVGVIFNAIDVKDAIIMLPLMNELQRAINHEEAKRIKNNLPKEEQKHYVHFQPYKFNLDPISVKHIADLLDRLGFVNTINETPADVLNEHERKYELK